MEFVFVLLIVLEKFAGIMAVGEAVEVAWKDFLVIMACALSLQPAFQQHAQSWEKPAEAGVMDAVKL